MARIKIKSVLIGDEKNIFYGKGILKGNEIIFNDNKIKTKIKVYDDRIVITREENYILKMEFSLKQKTKATYNMNNHIMELNIETRKLEISDNNIKIKYILDEKMNFIYNIEYSIDSE